MSNLQASLNELLQKHGKTIEPILYSPDRLNDFLREAYQINSRISELVSYLRSIRRAYLSTAPPPRQTRFTPRHGSSDQPQQNTSDRVYLTDTQRDAIDTEAKATLRDINAMVTRLSQAEKVRQETETALTRKRRKTRGLGALGAWAAGGEEAAPPRNTEEVAEDEARRGVNAHRESVLWFLSRGIELAGNLQGGMMEIRIMREVEKGKSSLSSLNAGDVFRSDNTRARKAATGGVEDDTRASAKKTRAEKKQGNSAINEESDNMAQQLNDEQMQLFAEENRDMLKHYEDRLDQVRQTEKSLMEISELQSTLAINLDIQAQHIGTLVQDSLSASEDVAGGNKELKKSSERRSTAKLIFYSTVGMCSTMILWDFFI